MRQKSEADPKWETWLTVKSVTGCQNRESFLSKGQVGNEEEEDGYRFPPKSRASVMDEFVQWPPPPKASVSGQGGRGQSPRGEQGR